MNKFFPKFEIIIRIPMYKFVDGNLRIRRENDYKSMLERKMKLLMTYQSEPKRDVTSVGHVTTS